MWKRDKPRPGLAERGKSYMIAIEDVDVYFVYARHSMNLIERFRDGAAHSAKALPPPAYSNLTSDPFDFV